MKRNLAIILIILFIASVQVCFAQKNTADEQESVLNCEKGDKILFYYETKTDRSNPDKYLDAAKYYYYQASRLDLSNADALIGHARIALHQNKLKEAKNVLMIALNYDELNPKTNFYLGETFFRDGEYSHAINYYKQAYSHGFAKDFKTNYQLGLCYEKMNENKKARTHFQIALSIEPDNQEAQKRLDELENTKTNMKNFDILPAVNTLQGNDDTVSPEEIKQLQSIMN